MVVKRSTKIEIVADLSNGFVFVDDIILVWWLVDQRLLLHVVFCVVVCVCWEFLWDVGVYSWVSFFLRRTFQDLIVNRAAFILMRRF